MPEPITISVAVAWLAGYFVQHVWDGVVGNEAHRLLRGSVHHVLRRIDGDESERVNHDIVRTVRLAEIAALERVLDGYTVANAVIWERSGIVPPTDFLNAAATFCRTQRRRARTDPASLALPVTETLEGTIDGLLARSPPATLAGGRAEVIGDFAEDAVLDEVRGVLTGVVVPDDFVTYLKVGAGPDHPRFLDEFADDIREAVKSNPRFRDIVLVSGVAEIKAQGFEITEILLRIEKQFGIERSDVLASLSSIDKRTERIETTVEETAEANERRHRELLDAIAREKGVDPTKLAPLFEHLGFRELTLDEMRLRADEAIDALLSRAAQKVGPSNNGADIDATISAARARLGTLDTAGTLSILAAKIAEEKAARRQRLVPLLEEQAAVEQLSYDYEAAKETLRELLALDPERVWSWIELGDLFVTTGALDPAIDAFRQSLAIADRLAQADAGNAGWQRDLATSNERLGDIYLQQGNREEARNVFRQALDAYELLIKGHPDDVQSRVFSVVPRWRLAALDSTGGRDHLKAALAILKHLAEINRLDANRLKWVPQIEEQLAALGE